MASRDGAIPAGTDGTDFAHRQKVASQFHISARNKSRLKWCFFWHFVLFVCMMAKLSADILDRLDIFILEIEELEIPSPMLWEYIWLLSLLFVFHGISALRKNNIHAMRVYLGGIIGLGVLPGFFAFLYYLGDSWEYITEDKPQDIDLWQGYPYGLIWYMFLIPAFQVHGFSLYFGWNLFKAWKARGVKKVQ